MDNTEFLSDFLEESYDLLEKARSALADFKGSSQKEEVVNSLYRWIHTIKGGCSVFNFKNTSVIAHALETKLGNLRKDPRLMTQAVIQDIQTEVEKIEQHLRRNDAQVAQAPEEFKTRYFTDFYADSEFIIKDMVNDGFSFFEVAFPKRIAAKVQERLSAHGLSTLQEAEVGDSVAFLSFAKLSENDNLQKIANELITKYQGQWCTPQAEEVQVEETKATAAPVAEVLRVPLKTVNSILDNVWDLFLVHNQMTHLVQQNSHLFRDNLSFLQQFEALDTLLERNIHELEARSMGMRMSPLARLFERMGKVIDDYCAHTSKKIMLKTSGGQIDLDKKILDSLNEPLIHLIRNAMDHGIESSEERRRVGKSDVGVVELIASVSGNEVHLLVKDDGKGIDAKKILASAKKKGLDVSNLETEQDIINLIFAPGFSTAEQVSDVSGRGVGMDAVMKSVLALGGDVKLSTELGQGTSFKIILPLSMSVSKSLIVRIKNLSYAISTKSILSVEKISPYLLKKNGAEEFYEFNGELIPCYDLGRTLPDHRKNPDLPVGETHVCVTSVDDTFIAFRVDEILQTLNVVMKPISRLVKKTPLLSGVSILPGGDPIFILNVAEVIASQGRSHES